MNVKKSLLNYVEEQIKCESTIKNNKEQKEVKELVKSNNKRQGDKNGRQ